MANIEVTEFLKLPLPQGTAKLKEDVGRIRDTLIALDAMCWKAYQTQYSRIGNFGQALTIISEKQTVKAANGNWYRYTGVLPYGMPLTAQPTDPNWVVVDDFASLSALADILGIDTSKKNVVVTKESLPALLSDAMATLSINNDQPLVNGFGNARFMAPATVTLPSTGTRYRFIVDHSVNVETQNCIITSKVAFVTATGESDKVRIRETGREWIFDFIGGKWRVSQ